MQKEITAIIIDDESRARILLQNMLQDIAPHLTILADCENLPSGIKAIKKHQPQLVFLDIEMPGHSGLELLDFFNEEEINFEIIFTTAYNQYAIKAFKMSAIDYILKPIDLEELQEAIKRFEKRQESDAPNYTVLKENINLQNNNKIAVPVGNGFRFIELNTIVYLKASSSYTEVFFVDESKLLVSRTLKSFEEFLNDQSNFFRCHKSYLVNTSFITDYVKSDGGYILLQNKIEIPISPEKTAELLENIKFIKR